MFFSLPDLYRNWFVKKAQEKSAAKEELMNELKEAIVELKLIEQGKLKACPEKELLNEL